MRAVQRAGEPFTFGFVPSQLPAYLAERGLGPAKEDIVAAIAGEHHARGPPAGHRHSRCPAGGRDARRDSIALIARSTQPRGTGPDQ